MIDPLDLNLRHLNAVAAATRLGSISAAAGAVNLSQPALTQAVSKLEAQLGTTLFARQTGGAVATEAGELLSTRIERALAYIVRGGRSVRRASRLSPLPNIERRITLGQLRALIAVDDAGSFALASLNTGLSQPALHRSARDLEQQMEVPLLIRQGKTVQPTTAAARFLRFARLARSELLAGLDELRGIGAKQGGRLIVCAMPLSRAILLPKALALFSERYPAASVNVIEGPYLELLSMLRQGESDLLIGAMRDPLPVADVVQEPLFADDPVIVGRSGHPLSGTDASFDKLLDFPWVIAARGTPVRQRWEQMFIDRGMEPPRLRIECGSLLVVRGVLLEGDWLSLMSRDQFLFDQRAGLLTEIGDIGASLRREIGLTYREDWRPTALQAAFVDTFRTVCDTWTSEKAIGREPFRYA